MNGKIALITGGSRGLGRNTALHLAKKGAGVVVTYRTKKAEAEEVVRQIEKEGGKAAALALDASDTRSFPSFVSELQAALKRVWGKDRLDFLVNNAGTGINRPIAETSEEEFDELMKIHFKGVFFLTQKLLPVINDGGRIVNLSSGLARFSLPGYAAYASMKGAIETFTRYLALELGPRRIRVNVLAPGAIETDFGGGFVRDNAQVNKMIASQTALGRVGLPDDIGGAISSLLSDDNAWVNGQRIEVSGGIHL